MKEINSLEDALRTSAWLVQYKPSSAEELRMEWNATTEEDEVCESPNIGRRIDEIGLGDFVVFWVSGPGDSAGAFAWGNASGDPDEFEYPKDWNDPLGPRVKKPGMEVLVGDVFEERFISRSDLKDFPEFQDFELFTMPNATNVFRVTPAQWKIIFHRLANAA